MGADLRELRALSKRFQKIRDELTSGGGPGGGTAARVEREMGGLDAKQNVQVFKRERDPETGARWERLSPSYEAWKRRNSTSRKVLVLTGRLKRSLTAPSDPKRVTRLQGTTITLGTTHELGAKHMQGDPSTNLPPRPMVGKTDAQIAQQERAWLKIVLDRIGSMLGGPAGLEMKSRASALRPDPRAF